MGTCAAPGCGRPTQARGYCARHYHQVRRHGHLTPERERETNGPGVCTEPGCDRKAIAKGLCGPHYWRARYEWRNKAVAMALESGLIARE
jgi:hypothetical protein